MDDESGDPSSALRRAAAAAAVDTVDGGGGAVRDRILIAAARLFARQGYSGTSLRALAGEAGVALSMVNYHFGTKAGVAARLFEVYFEALLLETAPLRDTSLTLTRAERVETLVRAIVLIGRRLPDVMRFTVIEWVMHTPALIDVKSRWTRTYKDTLGLRTIINAELPEHVRPEFISPALSFAVQSLFLVRAPVEMLHPVAESDETFEAYSRHLTLMLTQGLDGLLGAYMGTAPDQQS